MPALRDVRIQLTTVGLRGMAQLLLQHRLGRRLRSYELCRPVVERARGLEIGGPSAIFSRSGPLPLYPLLESLDNADFAGDTIWHGEAAEGAPFRYDPERPPGRRLIRDATNLAGIADGSYDVLLSSHTLEHLANPLGALAEWKRVVGPAGHLILVVPHSENTFDHRRPVTTLAHLEADLAHSTAEDDDTHLQEFMELCDLRRVPERLSRVAFETRTRQQLENRTVHHHVFDTELVGRLLDRAGFRMLGLEPTLPFHIVAVARAARAEVDNDAFLSAEAGWRRTSVFQRDRRAPTV
ncbi:MAG TPA: methyltransferase domain-containing protein [Gaiellaceae bacterium]|nr:methyltransferase domain-containing protein [Gaiellaceae bacterium]